MRKSRRNYAQESRRTPFELTLDSVEVEPGAEAAFVTFKDPNKLETADAFALARSSDPEQQIRLLLSVEDFDRFWSEWATAPIDETNALLEDVLDHYGANRGKPGR